MDSEIANLTNRHIAKLLTKLDEINTSEIVKDSVKKHFWFLSNDLEEHFKSKERANGKDTVSKT